MPAAWSIVSLSVEELRRDIIEGTVCARLRRPGSRPFPALRSTSEGRRLLAEPRCLREAVSLGRRRDARHEGGRAPRVPICADPSYADKAQKGSTRRAHESTAGVDGFAAVRSYSPIPRP